MTYSENIRIAMHEIVQKKPNWVQIGLFILKVGNNKSWKQMSPTFKDWLSELAKHLGSTRASLFKYRAGVKVAVELRRLNITDDESTIVDALSKTKADIIEMLANIIPRVSESVAKKLVDDVFSGALTRAQVKDLLRLYKQSDDKVGDVNEADEKAEIIATLVRSELKWLQDYDNIVTYKLVANLQYQSLEVYEVFFDAVLAVKRKVNDGIFVEIHGLNISRDENYLLRLNPMLNHCDFQWLIFDKDIDWKLADIPDVGALLVSEDKVTVLRNPTKIGYRVNVALTAHALLPNLL